MTSRSAEFFDHTQAWLAETFFGPQCFPTRQCDKTLYSGVCGLSMEAHGRGRDCRSFKSQSFLGTKTEKRRRAIRVPLAERAAIISFARERLRWRTEPVRIGIVALPCRIPANH
jgi:hypothetical protein